MESIGSAELRKVRTTFKILFFVAFSGYVAGCNRPATPIVHEAAKEEPTPDSLPSSVAAAPSPKEGTPQSPLPPERATALNPATGFANPAANEAWNQYVDDFQAARSVPPPQVQDPLGNPAQVTGYINQLGDRLRALQHSREAVEANLSSPEEKKRFRAAEKSLVEDQNK